MKLAEENKVLNLRRNGFVIAPELNFSDDGNRFTGYYYDPEKKGDKRFETSKLVADGQAYISVHYYNPETGKTTYFDDLNGVDYSYAIEHIKDLTDKVDAFKAKLDAGEIKAVELTDEEFQSLKDKIKQVMELTNLKQWPATQKVFDKLSIDYNDLKTEQRDRLNKEIESEVRNARTDNPVLVKEFAKAAFKQVLKDIEGTKGSYGYRGRWEPGKPPKSLDDALKSIDPYISTFSRSNEGANALIDAGLPENEIYYFKHLTDANQEKIKDWVKNKIENLYDFE